MARYFSACHIVRVFSGSQPVRPAPKLTLATTAHASSFKTRTAQNAALVDSYLNELFAEIAQDGVPERTLAAMKHGLLAGGKRFRPFLVIETARLFGIPSSQSTPTASALECVHAYSLIHDDLPAMDDDDLRRGKPTVHIAFDEATAILAGDALLTLAFQILGSDRCHPDPAIRASLVSGLARAAGAAGMVGGQQLDLEAEAAPEHTLDQTNRIQRMKTGALISYACHAGCCLGSASEGQRQAMAAYADNIGLAFQLADDLLDTEGDAAVVGKATGKDADAGKSTYVDLLGAAETRIRMHALIDEAIDAIAIFGQKSEPLTEAARFVVERDH